MHSLSVFVFLSLSLSLLCLCGRSSAETLDTLQSLQLLSANGVRTLSPPFTPSIRSYTATYIPPAEYVTGTVEIRYTRTFSSQSVYMGSNQQYPVAGPILELDYLTNIIYIYSGTPEFAKEIYRITITPDPQANNYLSALAISVNQGPLTPISGFSYSQPRYDLTFPYNPASVNVRISATAMSSNAIITTAIDNSPAQPYPSNPYTVQLGVDWLRVYVTAANGNKRFYYLGFNRLPPSRNCSLQLITTNVATTLSPSLQPDIKSYRILVPYQHTSVTINPVPTTGAILYNNAVAFPRTVALPSPGIYPISVSVRAEDSTTICTYSLDVIRSKATHLESLKLSSGKLFTAVLSPMFEPLTIFYTTRVPSTYTNLFIQPTPTDNTQRIDTSLNGAAYTQMGLLLGTTVTLAPGTNTLRIRVTATDAASMIYTITINRS